MKKQRLKEIVRFCFVGGVCFLIDYSLLYILTEYAGIHYLRSAGISFSLVVILNYWLCVVYVFKDAVKQTKKRAVIFIGSSAAGLLINQLCMWFFVEIIGIYYMIAKIFATAIVTVWNYVLKRKAVQG